MGVGNTFQLLLGRQDPTPPRTGPYSIYSLVKERSAFWGPTADDAEGRRAVAGGRLEAADMVLRMRVRPPARPSSDGDGPEAPRRDGNALALLRAVGGLQASCAAAAPPNAGPVSWFMLYEREFPDSVAASLESLAAALDRVEAEPHDSAPVLRAKDACRHGLPGTCRPAPMPSARSSTPSSRSSSGSMPRYTTASSIPAPW